VRRTKDFLFRVGKEKFWWCDNCNIPTLSSTCLRCGGKSRGLKASLPGDLRPAWNFDLKLIRKVVNEDFGNGIGEKLLPSNKLVLLNKIPGIDWTDEVIIDGLAVGLMMFDVREKRWRFMPKIEGARRIYHYGGRKWVRVDEGATRQIINKRNVMAAGILDVDDSIRKGDYVYILSHDYQVIAVGRARMNGKDMKAGGLGVAVKTKMADKPGDICELKSESTWSKAVEANREYVEEIAKKATKFIIETTEKQRKPIVVAFSGGKDSACVLNLAMDALGDSFKIAFLDTGLEFPETINYTKEALKELDVENLLLYETAGDAFWKCVNKLGPPSRDHRWCCKVCKLRLMSKIVKELGGECLTFVGQRKYESMSRAAEPRITRTIHVPGQVRASPIKNWNLLHVWLYLGYKKMKVNSLYFKGHVRIGCFMCPASDLAELELVRESHAELWSKWEHALKLWAETHNLDSSWIKYGLWRWRRLPRYWKDILGEERFWSLKNL